MRILLVVDVQRDFFDDGTMPINGAAAIVPVINMYIKEFIRLGSKIVYTRNWHPSDHKLFRDNGGQWSPHCIQGTVGADFHPDLNVHGPIFSKGMDGTEENSAAAKWDSDLVSYLIGAGASQIYVCGVGTERYIKPHVLDLLEKVKLSDTIPALMWKQVWCMVDACAAINAGSPEDGHEALLEMKAAGAQFNMIKQKAETR